MNLGIRRIHSLHQYVHDLDRTRRFFVDGLDFREVGGRVTEHQRSATFRAGQAVFVVSEPIGDGGRASRYLRKHPEGIGAVVFEVDDIQHAWDTLLARGATPLDAVQTCADAAGSFATFSITTPFGDTTFRFVECRTGFGYYPGFTPTASAGGGNRFGFGHVDHVTSNLGTMAPTLLWLEHVMGFERYWDVAFHTADLGADDGSGLASVVMWDRESGVKLANNEPARPHFKQSQINVFVEDNRGPGVQHAALSVTDILGATRGLRERGLSFLATPEAYYDALPERLAEHGITLDESIDELAALEILVDGAKGGYLLQVFMAEAAALHGDPEAGPFFIELIQRKGDDGFGAGNFRALFESIERQQMPGRP